MRKTRFSEDQIIATCRSRKAVGELCRRRHRIARVYS